MTAIKKIKVYAIISFLLPLITINACFLLYKTLADLRVYTNLNWDAQIIQYDYNQNYIDATESEFPPGGSFTNCPKYKPTITYLTFDNQAIVDTYENKSLIS